MAREVFYSPAVSAVSLFGVVFVWLCRAGLGGTVAAVKYSVVGGNCRYRTRQGEPQNAPLEAELTTT